MDADIHITTRYLAPNGVLNPFRPVLHPSGGRIRIFGGSMNYLLRAKNVPHEVELGVVRYGDHVTVLIGTPNGCTYYLLAEEFIRAAELLSKDYDALTSDSAPSATPRSDG